MEKCKIDIIGSITKSGDTEIRVSRSTYQGRSVVDIRIWYLPNGATELVPTRKGITIEENKAVKLAEILTLIRLR